MYSKVLVKLIDEAIVPAVVLLAVKVISSILYAKYFGITFDLGLSGFIYNSTQDYLLINSYSTLTLVIVIGFGLFYILIKSHLFHETHVHPSHSAKLFTLKLSRLIQTSFDVYSQSAIWLFYSYLVLIASGIMAYFGLLYPWVAYISLITTLTSSYLLVMDIEREIGERLEDSPEDIEEEELVLQMEVGDA